MLKRAVNECRFTLVLTAKSPLIVKEGRHEKPAKTPIPDSIPIRRGVWHGNNSAANVPSNSSCLPNGAEYYLPGTSIRGVLRCHTERIVRTMAPDKCCDLFQKNENAPDRGCGFWMDEGKIKGSQVYRHSCVTCRLFGSTSQASRMRIGDGDIEGDFKVSLRDHVGIDRFSGGVSQGPFQDLLLEQATFRSQVTIRNFELWQLGLLAYVVRDLACWEDGLIRLGYGKTKGYGLMEGRVEGLTLVYYGTVNAEKKLIDLGDAASPTERKDYDLKPGSAAELDFLVTDASDTRPYCTTWQVPDANLPAFWEKAASAWKPEIFSTLAQLRPEEVGAVPGEKENSCPCL
jgi:CRISPR/Cas system CSM-associated protein Csm3 (group 7 of RAMP superfamily)